MRRIHHLPDQANGRGDTLFQEVGEGWVRVCARACVRVCVRVREMGVRRERGGLAYRQSKSGIPLSSRQASLSRMRCESCSSSR